MAARSRGSAPETSSPATPAAGALAARAGGVHGLGHAGSGAGGTFASSARVINALANAGLVAKSRLLVGIPASSQRAGSPAQERGRYSARSIRACPRGAAYVR